VRKPEGKRPLGRPRCGKVWTGCIWLSKGQVAGSCVHGDEPLGSIKGGNFLD